MMEYGRSVPRTVLAILVCTGLAAFVPARGAKKDRKGDSASGADRPAYLTIDDCPDQPGCPALVLLDDIEWNNDAKMTYFTYRRVVKVFTPEGVDRYSNIQVPARVGSIELRDLTGRTILPNGTTIPLTPDNITAKTLKRGKRKVRYKSATFPGVEPGAVLELVARSRLESYTYLMDYTWPIQETIPALKTRLTLKQGKYKFTWRRAGMESTDLEIEQTGKNVYTFTATHVPGIPDEPYGPYRWSLQDRIHFFMPEIQESWIASLAGFVAGHTGDFVEATPSIEKKAAALVAPTDSSMRKVGAVYRFIQEEIGTEEERADETESSHLEDARNAGEVLARGYGDEWDRTLLFVALARAAGLETGFLLVSSRLGGSLDLDDPDWDQFDSYAAAVKTGRGWMFYDPATLHCPAGTLSPEKETGTTNSILVIPQKGAGAPHTVRYQNFNHTVYQVAPYKLIDIPITPSAKNILTREVEVQIEADGSAVIDLLERGTGFVGQSQRDTFTGLDDDERREKLRDRIRASFPEAEILEASFDNLDDLGKNPVVKCQVRVPQLASKVGNRLLLSPSIFHSEETNPFTEERRMTAIQFPYPKRIVEWIDFRAPEGFILQQMPRPIEIDAAPLGLNIWYSGGEGRVRYSRTLDIDTATWPVEDYDSLKSFFENLYQADRDTLIFIGGDAGGETAGAS